MQVDWWAHLGACNAKAGGIPNKSQSSCEHVDLPRKDNLHVQLLVLALPSLSESTLLFDGVDWRGRKLDVVHGNGNLWVAIKARDREGLKISDSQKTLSVELWNALAPLQTIVLMSTETQHGYAALLPTLPPGEYKLWLSAVFSFSVTQSMSAPSLPTVNQPLKFEVQCPKGHVLDLSETGCTEAEMDSYRAMGITIGCILALCVGLLLFYLRRHRHAAKGILLSFIRLEVRMALRITTEGCT